MRWAAIAALAPMLLGAWGARPAFAGFLRGTLKVDVRDAAGKPIEAKLTIASEVGGAPAEGKRVGAVYVAAGLIDGVWVVTVEGAAPERAQVRGLRTTGVVVVLGGGGRGKKRAPHFTVAPDEPTCDGEGDRPATEVVAFAHGVLAAGRLEARAHGRLVCAVTIAGGGATLRLPPGDYDLEARLAGGARTGTHLRIGKSDRPPATLLLRAR